MPWSPSQFVQTFQLCLIGPAGVHSTCLARNAAISEPTRFHPIVDGRAAHFLTFSFSTNSDANHSFGRRSWFSARRGGSQDGPEVSAFRRVTVAACVRSTAATVSAAFDHTARHLRNWISNTTFHPYPRIESGAYSPRV
jgi:hypothetical protein